MSVACTVGSLNRHILLYDVRATEEAQNAMTGYKSCNKRGTAYQQTNFPTEDYSHGALGGGGGSSTHPSKKYRRQLTTAPVQTV